MYRSPECPPLIPASPSPVKRILVPVSTPAGILTLSFFDFSTLPCPLQRRHGFFIICPRPEHVGQVLSTVKNPCCALTFPTPEQVGQDVGLAPLWAPVPLHVSQETEVGISMLVFLYHSSKIIN